ncbi:MAG: hypothetical protein ACLQPH_05870 [Acidimicrobiales bacterium]
MDELKRNEKEEQAKVDAKEDAVVGGGSRTETPGDLLRALPTEAKERGTRFVSAQAMQARLFSVYDAAEAAEEALALVQEQLTLTLKRAYYEAGEIESMADQLDSLLTLESIGLGDSSLVPEE